jgi:hypothetical protein
VAFNTFSVHIIRVESYVRPYDPFVGGYVLFYGWGGVGGGVPVDFFLAHMSWENRTWWW